MSGPQSELSGYATLPEPDLLFAGNQLHKHPLLGLIKHGPYGVRYGTPSTLRLALVAPRLHQQKLPGLIRELNGTARPKEAMALLADGFHMATHAGALFISVAAYVFARRHASDPRFTFGTGKLGDLAGFASAIILALIALLIGYDLSCDSCLP